MDMFLGMSAVVALEAQHRMIQAHRHSDAVVALVRHYEGVYGRSPDAIRMVAGQVRQYQLAALDGALQQDLTEVYDSAFRAFLQLADYQWLVSDILEIPYQPQLVDVTCINRALADAAEHHKAALAYHIRTLAKRHGRMSAGYGAIVAELSQLHRNLMESVCADDQFGLRAYLPALLLLVDAVDWADIVGSVLGDPVDSCSRYMTRFSRGRCQECLREYADTDKTAEFLRG